MPTSTRPQPEPLYLAIEVGWFAAQAIAAHRPDLRGRPFVVVQQATDSHHAAVYSCSAQAAESGIEPGMPLFAVRRKCPRAATVSRERTFEAEMVERLRRAADEWTPRAVVSGRVRCCLDLSGTPAQRELDLAELASQVKADVGSRTSLQSLAVGLSRSALIARMLAREALPGGIAVCPPGSELDELAGKEIDLLPGLSRAIRDKLRKYGLRYVYQVQRLERRALVKRLGWSDGGKLYGLVRGLGDLSVRQEACVIEAETVLRADMNEDYLLAQCARLTADRMCHKLRAAGLVARRLTFRLRHTDNRCVQRSARLARATSDFDAIAEAAVRLFEDAYVRRAAIKSMSLRATRPSRSTRQIDLFETRGERQLQSLAAAITDIRHRLGFEAVLSASTSHPELREAVELARAAPAAGDGRSMP